MIINKEEVEKAAIETRPKYKKGYGFQYGRDCEAPPKGWKKHDRSFKLGVEFAESKWNEYFIDIITENQGLKLYKDNEAERFKELAVEFARYIRSNPKEVKDYSLTIFEEGKFVSDDVKHYDNIEELFETFLKERNEKN